MKLVSSSALLVAVATTTALVATTPTVWSFSPQQPHLRPLVMQDNNNSRRNAAVGPPVFSLGSIFGGKNKGPSSSSSSSAATTTSNSKAVALEPHPSVRDHISPLNRLAPNNASPVHKNDDEALLPVHPDVRSGVLDNGLPYIILPNKSPPGRFEAHLQVFSGSGM